MLPSGNTMCSKTLYLKKKAIPERFSPMQVQVPPGVQIGRGFPVQLPSGGLIRIRAMAAEGQTMQIQVPTPPARPDDAKMVVAN